MAARQRLPKRLRGPLGLLSLVIGIAGVVLGYVLVVLGVTMYFDLNSRTISNVQSSIIVVVGLVWFVVAYGGWRGFMRLSY